MTEFDEMNENTEETEDTVRKSTNFDFAKMVLLFLKIAIFIFMFIGYWFALAKVSDRLDSLVGEQREQRRYNSMFVRKGEKKE